MKAILMTQPGLPDLLELRDIEEPAITEPSQIKVRLRAAGINPVDTKIRRNGLFYPNPLPAVLGCDGAGEVVEIGGAVSRFNIGDSVWFCHGGLGGDQGNYAEYTVLDERWAAPMPQSLDFEHAAAAPLVLITAWGALYDRGRLQAGQTVLIHAAAGGVGHVAVQLAKLRDARVLATVGSAEKAELAKNWGADAAIDYRQEDFAQRVNELTDGQGADLVIDTVGPDVFRHSIDCTAHFGDLVTLLDPGNISLQEARMRNLRIGFELMLTPMLRNLHEARDHHVEILQQCGEWIDQGVLDIHVSQVLPLEKAAAAHALIETGHTTGKIVLKIS
ncbi:zinc-dependent alcohol dehydrogenase family protein [Methylocaldum sp. RMAD-M]|jgi:NADPH2:quinone reductase|uniref:zinc-dependent alcohol dehydrogenase family protein n=1 Tax=unclassified Methylocaldum TaxID=2622260 RepID=UPI000A329EE2|nr:zinc-dependent alcohol dehydrogenase family protein [Methylocaldum sp. RMAD-M]MBP1149483.1 NADPH2:quinone reductase [Methylocaldum sp. RMAD-M]